MRMQINIYYHIYKQQPTTAKDKYDKDKYDKDKYDNIGQSYCSGSTMMAGSEEVSRQTSPANTDLLKETC